MNEINQRKSVRLAYYLNIQNVKNFCKERNKSATKEYLFELDRIVHHILEVSCATWNGGHKRLDSSLIPKKYR